MPSSKQKRIRYDCRVREFRCKRNKGFPNNKLPVLVYQRVLALPAQVKKAAKTVEDIFLRNGWSNSWLDGIYDVHHFHSNTPECMAIVSGNARLVIGGPGGRRLEVGKGDVIILPAGVGHRCLHRSFDFSCVGAYPGGRNFDILYGKTSELADLIPKIRRIQVPAKDPVFGNQGFLKSGWR